MKSQVLCHKSELKSNLWYHPVISWLFSLSFSAVQTTSKNYKGFYVRSSMPREGWGCLKCAVMEKYVWTTDIARRPQCQFYCWHTMMLSDGLYNEIALFYFSGFSLGLRFFFFFWTNVNHLLPILLNKFRRRFSTWYWVGLLWLESRSQLLLDRIYDLMWCQWDLSDSSDRFIGKYRERGVKSQKSIQVEL
jgi:hypothetical protein